MIEEKKKSPEVELDTDGVEEQTISVEEKKVESKEELPKQEVDLGYTEPLKPGIEGIKVEEVEDKKESTVKPKADDEDDLSQYSDSVKKRIDRLTYKVREHERREKAALEFAKGVQKQLDEAKQKYSKTSKSYIEQFTARVNAEQEKARGALKEAIELQDADKIADANARITHLAIEAEKAKMTAEAEAEKEAKVVQQPSQTQQPQTQQTYVEPSKKAKFWAEKNEWFGNDKILTGAAFTFHDDLISQGFDAESDEYYNEIDKLMRDTFPQRFNKQEQKKPVQTVASAQRNQAGRRSVKLTKSQIAIAKKLGVPLEEYAKYVKENN